MDVWQVNRPSFFGIDGEIYNVRVGSLGLGSGAERRRKFERCRSSSIFRTPGDYLFKCRDCKHNGCKNRTCIGDKRAICAYALPDDHEPRNIATDKHAQSVR